MALTVDNLLVSGNFTLSLRLPCALKDANCTP